MMTKNKNRNKRTNQNQVKGSEREEEGDDDDEEEEEKEEEEEEEEEELINEFDPSGVSLRKPATGTYRKAVVAQAPLLHFPPQFAIQNPPKK